MAAMSPPAGVNPLAAPVEDCAAAEPLWLAKPVCTPRPDVVVAVVAVPTVATVVCPLDFGVELVAGNLIDQTISLENLVTRPARYSYALAALHQLVSCCCAGAAAGSAGQLL